MQATTSAMSLIKNQVKDIFNLRPKDRIRPIVHLYPRFFAEKHITLVKVGVVLHETIHGMGLHDEQATEFLTTKILEKVGYLNPFEVTSELAVETIHILANIYQQLGCPLDEKHAIRPWIEMFSKPGPHYLGGYNYADSSEFYGAGSGTFYLFKPRKIDEALKATLSSDVLKESDPKALLRFNY